MAAARTTRVRLGAGRRAARRADAAAVRRHRLRRRRPPGRQRRLPACRPGRRASRWSAGRAAAGRRADPTRADEVTIGGAFHRRTGLGIGDELTLRIPGRACVGAMIAGQPPPDVARTECPSTSSASPRASFWRGDCRRPTAFYAAPPGRPRPRRASATSTPCCSSTAGRRRSPRLQADLDRLAGRPIEVMDVGRRSAQHAPAAPQLETAALLAFAVAAALVIVRARRDLPIVRTAGGVRRADCESLRALGFTRRRRRSRRRGPARPQPRSLGRRRCRGRRLRCCRAATRSASGARLEPSPGRHANVAGPGRRRRGARRARRRRRARSRRGASAGPGRSAAPARARASARSAERRRRCRWRWAAAWPSTAARAAAAGRRRRP